MRVFSFGGGVQSMAVLVLAARGDVQYDAFLFSNVGHDSEYPKTLEYFTEVADPYAVKHGIPLHELQKTTFGEPETLVEFIYRTKRSIPIPARMSAGAEKLYSRFQDSCHRQVAAGTWRNQRRSGYCRPGHQHGRDAAHEQWQRQAYPGARVPAD